MTLIKTTELVSFLCALLFLFACCLWMILYSQKAFAWVATKLLNLLVMPSGSSIEIGSISFAPIQLRIFFKDVSYATQDFSFQLVDGHLTCNLRGYGVLNTGTARLTPFMCRESLIGHTVEVYHERSWKRATVVGIVEREEVKPKENDDGEDLDEVAPSKTTTSSEKRLMVKIHKRQHTSANSSTASSPSGSPHRVDRDGGTSVPVEELSIEVPVSGARIAVKPSRLRLHINGLGGCFFNASGRYRDLEELIRKVATDEDADKANTNQKRKQSTPGGPKATFSSSHDAANKKTAATKTREEVDKLRQESEKNARSFLYLMKLLSSIDIQLFASYIDFGGLGTKHPYFLHFGFERADISYYLTAPENELDLFRHIVDAGFENIDLRWAPLDINVKDGGGLGVAERQSPATAHSSRMRRLKERATLMFQGIKGKQNPTNSQGAAATKSAQRLSHQHSRSGGSEGSNVPDDLFEEGYLEPPSELVKIYGTIIDAAAQGRLRLWYYWDAAGIHGGGSEPAGIDELPKMGADIEIDVKQLSYGPWSNYSRAQLQQHFLPPTFAPLSALKFVPGEARPYGGFCLNVEFVKETRIVLPFKLKTPTPSPPFGIRDSQRSANLSLTIGAGSHYIFRPSFVQTDPKTGALFGVSESVFDATDVVITTSLHGGHSRFLSCSSMRLFSDILSPQFWNQKSEMDTIVVFKNTELYYYAEHIGFIQAFTADWNHVPQMYSGEPYLSSKIHTKEACVDRFYSSIQLVEVFFEDGVSFLLNANPQNVLYNGGDASSRITNHFLKLKSESAIVRYNLPLDKYLIDDANEQVGSFHVVLERVEISFVLPRTHPLKDFGVAAPQGDDFEAPSGGTVAGEASYALRSDALEISGKFVAAYPNMSTEQMASRLPTNQTIGRSALVNSLTMDVDVRRLYGAMMGHHVAVLLSAWDNLFGSSTAVVSPEDLFRFMHHDIKGPPTNRVSQFLQFLQRGEPKVNELETIFTIRVRDIEIGLSCGRDGGATPLGNDQHSSKSLAVLQSHQLNMSVAGQTSASDLSLELSPLTLTFQKIDSIGQPGTATGRPQNFHVRDSVKDCFQDEFIAIGGLRFGKVNHFGSPPQCVHFHGVTEILCGELSMHMSVDSTVYLVNLLKVFQSHMAECDPLCTKAIATAEQNANAIDPTESAVALQSREGLRHRRAATNQTSSGSQSPSLDYGVAISMGHQKPFRRRNFRCSILENVPENTFVAFAGYVESQQKLIDESIDYGVFTMRISTESCYLNIFTAKQEIITIKAPNGIHIASSTLNDTNSNKRLSAAVHHLTIQGLVPKQSDMLIADVPGDHLEVFSLTTSITFRQCVAYPHENGLISHFQRQAEFFKLHDYERLVRFSFDTMVRTQSLTRRGGNVPPSFPVNAPQEYDFSIDPPPMSAKLTSRELEALSRVAPATFSAAATFEERIEGLQRGSSDGSVERLSFRSDSPDKEDTNTKSGKFFSCISHQSSGNLDDSLEQNDIGLDVDEVKSDEISDHELANVVDLFSQDGSRQATPSNPLAETVANKSSAAQKQRNVLEFYRCLRSFDILSDVSTSTFRYSSTATFSRFGRRGDVDRDYTNFYSHIPSVYFVAAQPQPDATGNNQTPGVPPESASGVFGTDYDLRMRELDNDFPETSDDSSGDKSIAWAQRFADNSRRSRDGSTTTHYHVESAKPIVCFATARALQLALHLKSHVATAFSSFAQSQPLPQQQSSDALPPARVSRQTGEITEDPRSKTVSRSRNKSRVKQWNQSDDIISIVLPSIEMKFLSNARVHVDNLVDPKDIREANHDGIYLSTCASKALHIVAQRTSPPSRLSTRFGETVKYAGSLSFETIAAFAQILYEPTSRLGNLAVNVPSVTYNQNLPTIGVAYITRGSVRAKRDFIGDNQGTVCRVALDSACVHVTRDLPNFVTNFEWLPPQPKGSQPLGSVPATPQEGRRARVVSPIQDDNTWSTAASSDDDEDSYIREAAARASSLLPKDAQWLLQGVVTVGTHIVVQLIDVEKSFSAAGSSGSRYAMRVLSEKPNCLRVVRPSCNFLFRKPPKKSSDLHPPPSVLQALCDIHTIRADAFPNLPHFVLSIPRGEATTPQQPPALPRSQDSVSSMSAYRPETLWTASITIRNIIGTVMQSGTNFVQVVGHQWTASVNTREEERDSPAMHSHQSEQSVGKAFLQSFPRVSDRLLKRAAKVRRRPRRCAAPPSTTHFLRLRHTMNVFADSAMIQYVADLCVAPDPGAPPTSPTPSVSGVSRTHSSDNTVVSFAISEIGSTFHATVHADSPSVMQQNIHLSAKKAVLRVPYRTQAVEVVQPQLQALVSEWKGAVVAYSAETGRRQRQSAAAKPMTVSASPPTAPLVDWDDASPQRHEPAADKEQTTTVLSCDLRGLELSVGLPQDSSVKLQVPQIAVFIQQSDQRSSIKVHLHPFQLSARAPGRGNKGISFPAVYLLVAHDEWRSNTTIMMETFEAVLTPELLNHLLMTFEKVVTELLAIVAKTNASVASLDDGLEELSNPATPTTTALSSATPLALNPKLLSEILPEEAPPKLEPSTRLVFALAGVRVSLVTTMSSVRLSLNGMSVVKETESGNDEDKWSCLCKRLQLAVVDRDDHDQVGQAATVDNASKMGKNLGSVASVVSADENVVRERPLAGFVWGLAEVTIAARATFVSKHAAFETAADSGVKDLNAVPPTVSSMLRVSVDVTSPLIVLRSGLPQILRHAMKETNIVIAEMREQAVKESQSFRNQMRKSKAYKQLLKQKEEWSKAMNAKKRLVAKSSLPIPPMAPSQRAHITREEIQSSSRMVAQVVINDLSVVIPFGDGAFKAVMHETSAVYSCSKKEKHTHNASCLNRKQFVPVMALKVHIEHIEGSMTSDKRKISTQVIPTDRRQSIVECVDIRDEEKSVGSLSVLKTRIFFTEGSKMDTRIPLSTLLAATKILGGHGTLTGRCDLEHPKSFNRVVIDSMDLPLQIEVGSDGVKRNQADLEISGPEVHVTSRFVALLGEVASEFVDDDIPLHPSTAAKQPVPPPTKKEPSGSPSPRRAGTPTATDMAAQITSDLAAVEVKSIIDVKCVLHPGSVVFYSVTAPTHSAESLRGQQFGSRRTVSFSASSMKHTGSIAARKRANENAAAILDGLASNPNPNATVILRIPLPMLAAFAQGRQGLVEDTSDTTTVRIEVRAENIEVVPAVATLFQEVQYWSKVHAVEFRDRANRVFDTVSKMEASATLSKNVFPMHSTILDVALPVPKAFVTQLNATRLALGTQDASDYLSSSVKSPKSVDGHLAGVTKRASNTALHVNITGVRITLSTAPLTSSAVLCTDSEGSIDIVVQMHAPAVGGLAPRPSFSISPTNRNWVHEVGTGSMSGSASTDLANTAITVSARRLRLECQGRLEVKCLEMILPECQMLCSIRNSTMSCGEWCKVTTVNVDVPAVSNQVSPKGGGHCCGPEMTVNASYLHQLFQVIFLWTQKWEEAKQATLLMFRSESNAARGARQARGSTGAAKRQNTARSFTEASHSRRLTEIIQVTANIGVSASRIDLGSGNKHDFSIAGVRVTARHSTFSTKETMSQCDVALLKTMIRSEGVLSGATSLERCIVKGFVIGNSNNRDEWEAAIDSMLDTTQSFAPGSLEPLRTEEGRTKRLMIRFTDLALHFKERQLRDLVLFSIGNLVVDVKDGLVRSGRDDGFDEAAALVHVDMNHCVACITPYTSTSFLNVAKDVGIILKDQQSKATTKMSESSGSTSTINLQGRGRHASDVSVRQQSVTAFVAFDEAEETENPAEVPQGDDAEQPIDQDAKAPPKRVAIGQLNVTIVDATIGLGTVIQVGSLQRGHAAGGSGEGAIVLVPQLSVSFAQSVGIKNADNSSCVKKILVIAMENLELLRPAEKKASIIAFRGSNLIEFFAQHPIDVSEGEQEVLYSLMLQQSSPWTGSPRIEDFQAIADVIKSFTHPQNANVLDEFIHVGHNDSATPAESPAKAPPPTTEAAPVKRTLTPIDRKRVRFAPQLRFGRDVSVSVDTILSWLGMREDMIPEKLLDSVCTPLEGLLSTLTTQ